MQPGESAGQQSERRRSQAASLRAQARLLNERASRVERSAEMWDRGYAGEQTVGAQLEALRPFGFEVMHDVRWPGRRRANIDHVAVGPPGILVVDAKNWSGNVTVHHGILRQNRHRRDREVAAVSQAGQDVGALLQLPWALHVIPVIALAGSDAGRVQPCQGVTILGQSDLLRWATALPAQLAPGDVLGIAAQLRSQLPSAAIPSPRQSRGSTRGRPPREPSARQRQRAAGRRAASRQALGRLAVLAALVVAGPSLVAWWGAHGDDVVRSVVPTPTFSAIAPEPATAAAFTKCADLRVKYPNGVKLAGAANTGKKKRGAVVVDSPAYRANAGLDRDKDGIACERTHAAKHKG